MNVGSELILGKMLPTTVVIVLRPFFGESRGRSGESRVCHTHVLAHLSLCSSLPQSAFPLKGITLQNLFAKNYTRYVLLIKVCTY